MLGSYWGTVQERTPMQFQAVTDQRVNGLKLHSSLVLPVLIE